MRISVFASKRIPGAKRLLDLAPDSEMLPRVASISPADGTDLEEALTTEWDTDAHFCCYHADDGEEQAYVRINKGPFQGQLEQDGGRVVVGVLVFDHDLPRDSHGAKQEWSADSLESFLGDLQEAVGTSNLEPTAWYTTLHGSRLVYVLDEAVDPQTAEAMMRGVMTEFGKLGIELDDACKDWTRLFRLPNVEREGHGRYTSEVMIDMDVTLAVADCPMGEVERGNVSATIDEYSGDMPDADECRDLLEEKRDNGRTYKSELFKMAKKLLIGRDAYEVIFDHKPMVKGETNWNDQVFRLTGQLVGMMAREPSATPEGLYALLHAEIEQLQDREMRGANETNWYELTWDHIVRNWNGEQEQIEAERQEFEARQAVANEQKADMVEAYREARPDDDVPEDGMEAVEWLSRRMIASNGSQHYVMRSDQSYNIRPCPDTLLIPTIRDLGMEDLIPTTEMRGKVAANRSSREIINDHAMPITDIECSVREDVAYIDGAPGHRKLHIPIHRLNPQLRPVFDTRVDEWLDALGGEHADLLKEWLSHSLDVKRPICALNLYGSPGTGKGMLATGMSECFETMELNDGRALGKWNGNLLKSPLVNCDEGVPNIASDESLTLDQAFRTLVTGGRITIREMRTNPFTAELFPRIMFTSNDRDIISSIVGHRDLTDDDTRAIELRLLSIEVSDAALRLLVSHGNFDYTRGWVGGGQQATDLTLANHIYYLFKNREDSQTSSGRLLVEGQVRTRLVNDLRMRSRDSETVLRAIVNLVNSSHNSGKLHTHEGRAWATSADVVDYVENNLAGMRSDLSMKACARVLKNFAVDFREESGNRTVKSSPPGNAPRKRWVEIDLGIVYKEGYRHGLNVDQVETMLMKQPDGADVIAQVQAEEA